ncbi:MAG: ABC transporter permease subunit [Clostridiales bacterium]|nr:ABC transporter permease subunit [Clostridiales bacterium]
MTQVVTKREERAKTWRRVKEYKWQYMMFLPAAILLILFSYMPMIGLIGAFKDYRIGFTLANSPWCGWENFQFFQDAHFWKVVRNTLSITVGRMVFGFPAPILLALLLNELQHQKFKRVVQSVSYMPHFVSWIVVAYLLESLLAPTGLFNQVNRMIGHAPVFYMGRSDLFSPIIIISGIWKDIGWNTIVYLAALSGIDPQLYEAAKVEGANKWQQTRFITIPCIMPTIVLLLTLAMPGLIQAGTDQIYPLMNTANMGVAEVIDIYVLRNGLQQGYYGMSTALGLVSSVLSLGLVLGTNKIAQLLNGEGLW